MCALDKLAEKLSALGHPLRLKILAILAMHGELYLSEIASEVGVSRALAKIHLRQLEKAGLVESRAVLVEGEAKALRYYKLRRFKIEVSPEKLVEELKRGRGEV